MKLVGDGNGGHHDPVPTPSEEDPIKVKVDETHRRGVLTVLKVINVEQGLATAYRELADLRRLSLMTNPEKLGQGKEYSQEISRVQHHIQWLYKELDDLLIPAIVEQM